MTVRVRIAPSPTGNLHIGTARTAVFNWLFARNQGGTFVLRVEDTDQERSRPEYTQNILEGLSWLGLQWDEGPVFQTDRFDLYQQKIQDLLDRGLAYRCYCTPDELDEMRSQQKARGEAPRYDNRHRNLTPEQRAAFEAEGRTSVIRFKIDDDRTISWIDLVRGRVTWSGRDLGGDMVIARAASGQSVGQPLYNFVVVVDDLDMAMTHVIRGEDHIGNTPKQILLYEALGAEVPEFGHTPLILNESGQKLSKRDGVTSISDFQALGYTPEAIGNYMTLLGWSPPEPMTERFTLAEAAEQFSFDRVNKAGAKFDWDKLNWLNSQVLHDLSPGELVSRLGPVWSAAGYDFSHSPEAWLEELAALIGPSLTLLKDAVELSRFYVSESIDYDDSARAQLSQDGAVGVLEGFLAESLENLDAVAAKGLINQVTKAQGVKKGLVMRTLRAALMGTMQGPDVQQSWLLLNQRGWDRSRLDQARSIAQGE
ncbi:MAG: glutamate--tRNA ligase [Prochlorothrix sp.]|nr:glutamate--tRNA ligase [Prochlorothrix sp.]